MDKFLYNPFYDTVSPLKNTTVNPYVKKILELDESCPSMLMYGDKLNCWKHKGQYLDLSNYENVCLEIGSYSGATLVDLARKNPQVFFIGMDITFKRVYQSSQAAVQAGCSNVSVFLYNALFLDLLFPKNFLDGVVIFFPDPWKKDKKKKNRLVSTNFTKTIYDILKPDAFFWLRTDQLFYYNDSIKFLTQAGFKEATDIFLKHEGVSSSFNTTFKLKKQPTYELIYSK